MIKFTARLILAGSLFISAGLSAQVPERTGWWKFDDPANLTKAEKGTDLSLTGTAAAISGPAAENGAVTIGTGSYFSLTHGVEPNGGGTWVNEWSIQVDFRIPETGKWYSIIQTNTGNSNDADFFIKPDGTIGVGSIGYTTATILPGEWYRLVLSVNTGRHFRYYLDGQLVKDGEIPDLDGRYGLDPSLLVFADDDGDDAPIDAAEIAFWGVPLTTWEAGSLGGFGHTQPVDPMTPAGKWTFENADRYLEGLYGPDLVLKGTQEAVSGPGGTGVAMKIGPGSHYEMLSQGNSGENVNDYTLVMDVKIPAKGTWYTFYQTDTLNTSDGDCFVNTAGNVGTAATGYTAYSLIPEEWYRVAVSVKNGDFHRIYLDGHLAQQAPGQDLNGRFSLSRFALLFGDNDGDDGALEVGEVSYFKRALSGDEIALLAGYGHKISDDPEPVDPLAGWWKFDDSADLLKAETGHGKPLELVGTHIKIDGPALDNGAVLIGKGSHYKITHGIGANGGGIKVNEYSLRFDFRADDVGTWKAFFQTSAANNSDADCFINTAGNIGTAATGYTPYKVIAGQWYRLVIVVKNGSYFRYYIDGKLALEGVSQQVDGRFALESVLLAFADEDGEDGNLRVAELAIWNYPLTTEEVQNLGGFGHDLTPKTLVRVPYLQTPRPTSMIITWPDSSTTGTLVEYGTGNSAGLSQTGTSELIAEGFRWHTVKLTGLTPDTEYSYAVKSGGQSSPVYKFRTPPDSLSTGKMRFLLFSDTHTPDSSAVNKVMRAAKAKVTELYGPDLQNAITAILHSGDLTVSGNTIMQFNDQFFTPLSLFTPNIPTMTTPGNHEVETPFYYSYMKYEGLSDFLNSSSLKEKVWSIKIGNTMVISLNTNIVSTSGAQTKLFLEQRLKAAEADTTVDFVMVMFHHPPFTELWVDALTYDAGPNFVREQLFPILKKYPKVRQITYGHTHAYEHGVIPSDQDKGDFRMICAGGGGGDTDRWGEFTNFDYPEINASMDYYHYIIMEADLGAKTLTGSVYAIGNASKTLNNVLVDQFHFKVNQTNPGKPGLQAEDSGNEILLKAVPEGMQDGLMSVRVQLASDKSFKTVLLDSVTNWRNIYGVDGSLVPVDKNKGVDLTSFGFGKLDFDSPSGIAARVKFRDQNLKWSPWSDAVTALTGTGIETDGKALTFSLEQNFPNPFNPETMIRYSIPSAGKVTVVVYDVAGKEISRLADEVKPAGRYTLRFNGAALSSGIYMVRIQSGSFVATKKMVLIK
ncbi:MAG: metallophosphoesterase [Bacteroidetes bacterium]|nr:metallophosphoesterase [Bacteroidota bacterium]